MLSALLNLLFCELLLSSEDIFVICSIINNTRYWYKVILLEFMESMHYINISTIQKMEVFHFRVILYTCHHAIAIPQ